MSAPNDLIPVYGWVLDLPGMSSPQFHKLQGLSKKTGVMTIIDGGTNTAFNFSDGIEENGPVTITRPRNGSADDKAFASFIASAIATGKKINGSMTQRRHGKVVLKILLTGLLMNDYKLTDFDTQSKGDGAKSDQTYIAHVDHWEEVYS